MANEIISYMEMCRREGASLQRGMNFRHGRNYSVVLMSRRSNAPYSDKVDEESGEIIYEGHDLPTKSDGPDPKTVDQPSLTPSGKLTENGKFMKAVDEYKNGNTSPERVRVYEKIKMGIWSYNGLFALVDGSQERDEHRLVYKFRLQAIEDETGTPAVRLRERSRLIPSNVKLEVWQRDGGKCVLCGAEDELHFDHVIPYSKGGASVKPENVQNSLCAA